MTEVTPRADAGCGEWIEAEELDLPHSGWTPLGGLCPPIPCRPGY